MKKKLKVKKAALGRFFGRRGARPIPKPIGGRPGRPNPNLINPVRPGSQPLPPMQPSSQIDPNSPRNIIFANPSQTGGGKPFGPPQTVPGPDGTPIRNPILNLINPIRPNTGGGMGPLPNNLGATQQPVGDPRRGGAFIPGNRMQEMMRGPQQAAPAQPVPTQQAAPAQPVPAMKKGGAVRGVRIALRGAKKATIY